MSTGAGGVCSCQPPVRYVAGEGTGKHRTVLTPTKPWPLYEGKNTLSEYSPSLKMQQPCYILKTGRYRLKAHAGKMCQQIGSKLY